LLLWDTWDQTTETQLPASAAYVQEGNTLHRIFCQASAADPTGSQTISDATIVHNLIGATPSCFTSTGGTTACDSGTPPPKVRLALVIASSGTDSAAPKQPVTLDAQRRQS
jgi:hypothetical protein